MSKQEKTVTVRNQQEVNSKFVQNQKQKVSHESVLKTLNAMLSDSEHMIQIVGDKLNEVTRMYETEQNEKTKLAAEYSNGDILKSFKTMMSDSQDTIESLSDKINEVSDMYETEKSDNARLESELEHQKSEAAKLITNRTHLMAQLSKASQNTEELEELLKVEMEKMKNFEHHLMQISPLNNLQTQSLISTASFTTSLSKTSYNLQENGSWNQKNYATTLKS